MTSDEASDLEVTFGLTFPEVYRDAITDRNSIRTDALDVDAQSLRESNEGCLKDDPWGFPWKPNYWLIGGDGAGGFYFIDTYRDDSKVYYCDHEDMATSIEDLGRIGIDSFDDFLVDLEQAEKYVERYNEEMKGRVANRKWWHFWIPREWPLPPKG